VAKKALYTRSKILFSDNNNVILTRPSFALVISPFLREDKLYFSNFYLLADKQWQNLGGEGSLRVFSY
jgi:hypothetical protein